MSDAYDLLMLHEDSLRACRERYHERSLVMARAAAFSAEESWRRHGSLMGGVLEQTCAHDAASDISFCLLQSWEYGKGAVY